MEEEGQGPHQSSNWEQTMLIKAEDDDGTVVGNVASLVRAEEDVGAEWPAAGPDNIA